jgi:hypothetical protein
VPIFFIFFLWVGYLSVNPNRNVKYLKKFEDENGYKSFCNGEQYIEPHVVLISNSCGVIYKKNDTNPLLGGITVREIGLGGDDTTALGITVYNYLKEKCGNGTNGASYTLLNNEELYCTYDKDARPSTTNEQTEKITYCSYEELKTPGGVNNEIRLFNDNSTPTGMGECYYFIIDGHTGNMSRILIVDSGPEMP